MDRTPDRPATAPLGTTAAGGATHEAAHDAARAAAQGQGAAGGGAGDVGLGGTETRGGNAAVGVAAGTVGGALAGLQAGALGGALMLGVGGLAGAAMGAAAGLALAADATPGRYTAESDTHYRALYEAAPLADRDFDRVRPAYAFGHLAASEPELAGRSFDEAEPALRAAWNDELSARAGAWEQARRHVRDAYGHARAEGAGERRVTGAVGSGGSAVDPVELDRARRGLPSVPDGQA
jgi:hypothetical protein